jgi:predicted P-loop ATPase
MDVLSDPTLSVKRNGALPLEGGFERWMTQYAEEILAEKAKQWAAELSPAERTATLAHANRQAVKDAGSHWRKRLLCDRKGSPKSLLANAILALRGAPEWQDVVALNELTTATDATRPPPWELARGHCEPRPWTPYDDVMATEWLQHEGISCGLELVQQAIEAVAYERKFHPVREYLRGVEWDGVPRIEGLASAYLGAAESAYTRNVSACFLKSAVARVMDPGCKVDHVPIIEGDQGAGNHQHYASLVSRGLPMSWRSLAQRMPPCRCGAPG